MKKIAINLCLPILLLFSCKKHQSASPPLASGIYAVGGSPSSAPYNSYVATIWENGVSQKLGVGNVQGGASYTAATGIAIIGSDIYVTGDSVENATDYIGAYLWKNGVGEILEGGAQANGIAVNGSDIYVVGQNALGHPCYWKNGIQTSLSQSYGVAQAIAFNGADMYIAGQAASPAYQRDLAAIWKNGVYTQLGDSTLMSMATCLAFIGSDIYAGGNYEAVINNVLFQIGCYWKNGQLMSLPSPLPDGNIEHIYGAATDGTNLWLAGVYQNTAIADTFAAVSYENAAPTLLPSAAVINANALGMSYINGDLYIAGSIASTSFVFAEYAAYWKNGVVTQLSTTDGTWLTALVIVP